jgi:nanoRNase/pAp phosphatase (c-di-AMP/oligoRNAs hydrolase)
VEEAILGDAPALKVNRSIQLEPGVDYARFLCKELRDHPLEYVAVLEEVKTRQDQVEQRIRAGLEQVQKHIRMEPGAVATFEAELAKDEMINRYSAYFFAPDARYSLGIIHSEDGTAITAMRNPWREFPSVALGRIFEKFGGGGHQRVGSIFIPKNESQRVPNVVKSLLSQLSLTGPAVNV